MVSTPKPAEVERWRCCGTNADDIKCCEENDSSNNTAGRSTVCPSTPGDDHAEPGSANVRLIQYTVPVHR